MCLAVAGGIIYADLWGELALTWSHRLCWLRVLRVGASATGFPLSKHWERWHCPHVFRPACLFTVHVGGGSSPLSSDVFLPLPLSEAFLLLLTGWCCCSCQPPCLFTVHVGSGSSLLSCGVFLPPPFSQASPLLVAGCTHSSSHRLSGTPGLFTVPGRIPFPQSSALRVPHPLSHVS
jgi:hypothetical protein